MALSSGLALAQAGPDPRDVLTGDVVAVELDENASCNSPAVIMACGLLPGAGGTVGGVIDPDTVQNLLVTNPASLRAGDIVANDPFRVRIDAIDKTSFSFTDLSLFFAGEGDSLVSQQAGTRGLEAVIVIGRNDNFANVYCETNWLDGQNLVTPSGNINKVEFCWSRGPCLIGQDDVDSICATLDGYSDSIVSDVLQTIEDTDEGPFNACGCDRDLRFCDPDHPDPASELSCDSGALTSLESQAIATGDSGGANLTFCSGGTCTKLK